MKNRDDCDHNEQLNERETFFPTNHEPPQTEELKFCFENPSEIFQS